MSSTNASAAATAPVATVARTGVPVRSLTSASAGGSRRSRPSTTSRRDWPSRPVMVLVTMPAGCMCVPVGACTASDNGQMCIRQQAGTACSLAGAASAATQRDRGAQRQPAGAVPTQQGAQRHNLGGPGHARLHRPRGKERQWAEVQASPEPSELQRRCKLPAHRRVLPVAHAGTRCPGPRPHACRKAALKGALMSICWYGTISTMQRAIRT